MYVCVCIYIYVVRWQRVNMLIRQWRSDCMQYNGDGSLITVEMCGSGSIDPQQGPIVGFCEHGNRKSAGTRDQFCAKVTEHEGLEECSPYISFICDKSVTAQNV
jgi:hypothetical protein